MFLLFYFSVIIHPVNGTNIQNDYDFALIRLPSPVDFTQNSHIRPACYPTLIPDTGTEVMRLVALIYSETVIIIIPWFLQVTVTGWGSTTTPTETLSNVLREVCTRGKKLDIINILFIFFSHQVNLNMVDHGSCVATYALFNGVITDQMICAAANQGLKDACTVSQTRNIFR